jgi:hypothetical protein
MSMLVEEIPAHAGTTALCSLATELEGRVPKADLLSRELDIAASNYYGAQKVSKNRRLESSLLQLTAFNM